MSSPSASLLQPLPPALPFLCSGCSHQCARASRHIGLTFDLSPCRTWAWLRTRPPTPGPPSRWARWPTRSSGSCAPAATPPRTSPPSSSSSARRRGASEQAPPTSACPAPPLFPSYSRARVSKASGKHPHLHFRTFCSKTTDWKLVEPEVGGRGSCRRLYSDAISVHVCLFT